jgi:dienelactone hydrolase
MLAISFVLASIAIIIFLLPYWIIPSAKFPSPTGKWFVGTTNLIWDASQQAGIIAQVWYPTNVQVTMCSPYLSKTRSNLAANKLFNLLFRLIVSKLLLGRITTTTAVNVTPSNYPEGWPVILFSPGFGGSISLNTFYALEFASHGFIVVGINHPGSCVGTMLSDGTQIEFAEVDAAIFADADRVESLVQKMAGEQAQNMSKVLDKLISLNDTRDSLLYQKINVHQVFAAGHSAGGASSFIACGQDRRITKGVNLDGYFVDVPGTSYDQKELLLIKADRDKYRFKNKKTRARYDLFAAKNRVRIEKLATKATLQQLTVPSTKHFDFSDLSILLRPTFSRTIGLAGAADGLELSKTTSTIMLGFFNRGSDYCPSSEL